MLQAADRVHFTHLKNFAESPAHYLASVKKGFDKPAYKFGRLGHYLVLGGLEDVHYTVFRELEEKAGVRNTNVYKAFVADRKKKGIEDVYLPSEVAEAEIIAQAVWNDPVVRSNGLLEGESELLVDWDNAGVPFRSHLDKLGVASLGPRKGRRHVADLKLTACSKPTKFHWDARRFGYHAQLATYMAASRSIKLPADDAFIIAVEKEPPYSVVVYELTPALLEEGAKLARVWLEQYRICKASGVWPGYVQDVVSLDVIEMGADQPLLLTMHDGSQVAA